jgi:hypothetical protein
LERIFLTAETAENAEEEKRESNNFDTNEFYFIDRVFHVYEVHDRSINPLKNTALPCPEYFTYLEYAVSFF